MVSEESVELDALLEVFDGFHASDLLQEVEITVHVDASTDQSVPVDALKSNVGVVLLELEVHGLEEVNVRALNGVHVVARHLKLIEVEVLGEDLHLKIYISINNIILKLIHETFTNTPIVIGRFGIDRTSFDL